MPLDDYDLILMDCQMLEMDGHEATRRIRGVEQMKVARGHSISRVPIIALIGDAMQGDRELCLEAGMDDYLSKPFTLDRLHAVVERWLSKEPTASGKLRDESQDSPEALVDGHPYRLD